MFDDADPGQSFRSSLNSYGVPEHLTYHTVMTYSILYTPTRGVWVIPGRVYKVIIMASEIKHTMEENVEGTQIRTMPMENSHATLALKGMTCASSAVPIQKALK